MATDWLPVSAELRKLRKKLRQIGNLERLDRPLTEEEQDKVVKKFEIRNEIQNLLQEVSTSNNKSDVAAELTLDASQRIIVTETKTSKVSSDHCGDFTDSASTELASVFAEAEHIEISSVGDIPEVKDKGNQKHEMDRGSTTQSELLAAEKQSSKKEAHLRKEISDRQTQAGKKKKAENAEHQESPTDILRKQWKQYQLTVHVMEGHCEPVTSLHILGNRLITSSMDTTVKIWDLERMVEERNLGGHTSTVTAAVLLSLEASTPLCTVYDVSPVHMLAVSGSLDCSFKIWSADSGQLLKSVYTFSPVTKMVCSEELNCIITGSDGGKVEVWDLLTVSLITSCHAHDDAVVQLQLSDDLLCSCSCYGEIKLYQIKDRTLSCIFTNENVHTTAGVEVAFRHIRSLLLYNQLIYYGDDGTNVKILNWKKALVQKLPNHSGEFGSTDALCYQDNLLYCASFDLDNGLGSVNVRDLSSGNYVCTLTDEVTERITSLACAGVLGNLTIVMGGQELKVWSLHQRSRTAESTVRPCFHPHLDRPGQDSEDESESGSSDLSGEDDDDDLGTGNVEDSVGGVRSWCSLV